MRFIIYIAGLGSKQQDILLSSFIKRIYAEIEKEQSISTVNLSDKQEQEDLFRKKSVKKSMTTPEAIDELKTLCIQKDPCSIYTDMVKIGEG
jgi:p21-activated kinase 1